MNDSTDEGRVLTEKELKEAAARESVDYAPEAAAGEAINTPEGVEARRKLEEQIMGIGGRK